MLEGGDKIKKLDGHEAERQLFIIVLTCGASLKESVDILCIHHHNWQLSEFTFGYIILQYPAFFFLANWQELCLSF
jgi:hypothetical protein